MYLQGTSAQRRDGRARHAGGMPAPSARRAPLVVEQDVRGGAERALESSESEDRHERVEELSDGQWLARVGSHGRGAHVQLDGGRAAR